MSIPKKGVAGQHYIGLIDSADTGEFKVNPTIAIGDFQISSDGVGVDRAFQNLATLPIVDPPGSDAVLVSWSAAENNSDEVVIVAKDAAGDEWDAVFISINNSVATVDDVALTDDVFLEKTTIAGLASQTFFTLTAGSSDDDAYRGCMAVITDATTGAQRARATIRKYTGSTKTVFLLEAPEFTIAVGDLIKIVAVPSQIAKIEGLVPLQTTIATLASQTSFTLTNGPTDNAAFTGALIVISADNSVAQFATGLCDQYAGSTKTVTLAADPGIFTMAVDDIVHVIPQAKQLPNLLSGVSGGLMVSDEDNLPPLVRLNTSQPTGWAANLESSAGQIIKATVDTVTNTHTPTTTVFQADNITEATPDHYNGRVVIFTSGVLAGQATDITDYVAVGGIGQFTVTAMTEAPSNNDTFVIV